MDFGTYQRMAAGTAVYPGQGGPMGVVYTSLGLVGEAGEIANKAKKIIRDDAGNLTAERKQDLAAELGDVLWYAAQLATELRVSLDEVALSNLDKLRARAAKGALRGSGDNR